MQCLGKRAQRAAIFQEELCLAILRGLRDQLIKDGRMRRNEIGIHTVEDAIERPSDAIRRHVCKFRRGKCTGDRETDPGCSARPAGEQPRQSQWLLKMSWKGEDFVDDLTGLPLPPDLCRAARKKELDYFESKGVWELRSVNEARKRMGRAPISVRWVETNKGDDQNPNIRSRLVAREIRTQGRTPSSHRPRRWSPSGWSSLWQPPSFQASGSHAGIQPVSAAPRSF